MRSPVGLINVLFGQTGVGVLLQVTPDPVAGEQLVGHVQGAGLTEG